MNQSPAPLTTPSGPFPLESKLRRLKPNLGRLTPVIAGTAILLAQEGLWQKLKEWAGTTTGIILIALALAVLLFYLADLYLRQVWFNERGIGIAKAWGGPKAWYSFDELLTGRVKMRKRSDVDRRSFQASNRIVLQFHTGTVRLWPNFYDSKGMAELLLILSRRFPDSYLAPESRRKQKKEMQRQAARSPKSFGAGKPKPSPTKYSRPDRRARQNLEQALNRQRKR